jgi:hypothetical protein
MMSRAAVGFRCGRRDVAVILFTPRRGWPGWCLGFGVENQRAGSERQVRLTLGVVQVEVEVIARG